MCCTGRPTKYIGTYLLRFARFKTRLLLLLNRLLRFVQHNDLSHSSSGLSDLASRTFRRTLDSYRTAVLSCLNTVYHDIYGDSEKDLLTIPGMPLLTVESCVSIYERGIVSPQTFAEMMCNATNTSTNMIDTQRLQLCDNHFLSLMKLEEQQTKANVDATRQGSAANQVKSAESGQQVSKKMRIANARTSSVGSSEAN